jgi:hypothetical protein
MLFLFVLTRVAQAYLNQKRLDAEAKQLHIGANNFSKQTQQWLNLIEGFSTALKVGLIYFICFFIGFIQILHFFLIRKLEMLKIGLKLLKTICES